MTWDSRAVLLEVGAAMEATVKKRPYVEGFRGEVHKALLAGVLRRIIDSLWPNFDSGAKWAADLGRSFRFPIAR